MSSPFFPHYNIVAMRVQVMGVLYINVRDILVRLSDKVVLSITVFMTLHLTKNMTKQIRSDKVPIEIIARG